jgi:hypothetical protein
MTEYNTEEPCILHCVDVDYKGFFSDVDAIVGEHGKEEEIWQKLINEKVCSVILVTFMVVPRIYSFFFVRGRHTSA